MAATSVVRVSMASSLEAMADRYWAMGLEGGASGRGVEVVGLGGRVEFGFWVSG